MSAQQSRFKSWEILLMVASILLLGGSAFVYIADIPLRKYLLGMEDSDGGGVQVGELGKADGKIRRQSKMDAQFDLLAPESPLYLDDTIMTGSGSTARIVLESGGTLDLSPNSMIRLNFESTLSLDGISRVPVVRVLAGKVQAQALSQDIRVQQKNGPVEIVKATTDAAPPARKNSLARPDPASQAEVPTVLPTVPALSLLPSEPAVPETTEIVPPIPVVTSSPSPEPLPSPSPSPSPSIKAKPVVKTRVTLLSPINKTQLSLPDHALPRELPVELRWEVKPDQPVEVHLSGKNGLIKKELIPSSKAAGRVRMMVKTPGTYTWELISPTGPWPDGKKYASTFTVAPEFQGIDIRPPLVGGEESSSNQFTGKHLTEFDVTLRWKPYPDAKKYVIRITNKERKVLIEKEVEGDSYSFNKKKIYMEQLYYSLSSKLSDGFTVKSREDGFIFNFYAPQLTYPFDQSTVSASIKAKGQQQPGTLFTWQKTNFTKDYLFEISTDPTFKTVFKAEKSSSNFVVIKGLRAGVYYWRVLSLNGAIKSSPRTPFQITITP